MLKNDLGKPSRMKLNKEGCYACAMKVAWVLV